MGITHSGCCCFGIVLGFLLTAATAGAIVYWIIWKENPDLPQQSIEEINEKWEKFKDSGDKFIEKTKEVAPKSAPEIPSII